MIVNDLFDAKDLDAIIFPFILPILGVEVTIDILAERSNRLTHYLVNLFGFYARDLEILHSILMCILFGFLHFNIAVYSISIGSN